MMEPWSASLTWVRVEKRGSGSIACFTGRLQPRSHTIQFNIDSAADRLRSANAGFLLLRRMSLYSEGRSSEHAQPSGNSDAGSIDNLPT